MTHPARTSARLLALLLPLAASPLLTSACGGAPDAIRASSGSLSPSAPLVVYASEGPRLATYGLDGNTGALVPRAVVTLPEQVQYAVADAERRFLYVSASNFNTNHVLAAFRIDPVTGELTPHGAPIVPAGGRVIHLSIDREGRHLILAHNQTTKVEVLALNADGTLGGPVPQDVATDTGFFTHQALIDDKSKGLVVSALGADATASAPEQPGRLTAFSYEDGRLAHKQTVLAGPGLGPRHVEFDGKRLFVAAERGNRVLVYGYHKGSIDEGPLFNVTTLAEPDNVRPRQRAGAIHVHPKRRVLYVSNRADQRVTQIVNGVPTQVFVGGENNIAVFGLDPGSGAPTLLQHEDTRGIEARTFALDPLGRFLVVGNQVTRNVLDPDGTVRAIPRSIAVFAVGEDGRLQFVHKRDVPDGDVFWLGVVALP